MLCDLGKVECKLIQRVRQHIKAESNCEVKTLLQFVTVLEEFKIIFHKLHKLCYCRDDTSVASILGMHVFMSSKG